MEAVSDILGVLESAANEHGATFQRQQSLYGGPAKDDAANFILLNFDCSTHAETRELLERRKACAAELLNRLSDTVWEVRYPKHRGRACWGTYGHSGQTLLGYRAQIRIILRGTSARSVEGGRR